MGKYTARQQERADGFMRSSWDLQKDIELTYGVRVSVALVPQVARKGVYRLLVEAHSTRQADYERRIAGYSRDYPNAEVGSLEAALFSALNRLILQVQDVLREEEAPVGF